MILAIIRLGRNKYNERIEVRSIPSCFTTIKYGAPITAKARLGRRDWEGGARGNTDLEKFNKLADLQYHRLRHSLSLIDMHIHDRVHRVTSLSRE